MLYYDTYGIRGLNYIKGVMKSEDCNHILERSLSLSVRKQGLRGRSSVSQDNYRVNKKEKW